MRGTQLKDNVQVLFDYGAREVHMRPACPTLIYPCEFLNFSTSRSTLDLAGRKIIHELEDGPEKHLAEYATAGTDRQAAMVATDSTATAADLAQVSAAGQPGGGHRAAQGKALHPLLGRIELLLTG